LPCRRRHVDRRRCLRSVTRTSRPATGRRTRTRRERRSPQSGREFWSLEESASRRFLRPGKVSPCGDKALARTVRGTPFRSASCLSGIVSSSHTITLGGPSHREARLVLQSHAATPDACRPGGVCVLIVQAFASGGARPRIQAGLQGDSCDAPPPPGGCGLSRPSWQRTLRDARPIHRGSAVRRSSPSSSADRALASRGSRAPFSSGLRHNGDRLLLPVFLAQQLGNDQRSSDCSLRVTRRGQRASCSRRGRIWPATSPRISVPTGPRILCHCRFCAGARSHARWRGNSCNKARPYRFVALCTSPLHRRSYGAALTGASRLRGGGLRRACARAISNRERRLYIRARPRENMRAMTSIANPARSRAVHCEGRDRHVCRDPSLHTAPTSRPPTLIPSQQGMAAPGSPICGGRRALETER